MAETSSRVVELLRYPLAIFSVLVAFIIAKFTLGISFGNVAEITLQGVKFSTEARQEAANLAGRVNGAIAAIEEIKKRLGPEHAVTAEAQTAIFAATQTVSDQTAQFAQVSVDPKPGSTRQRGYIWIGDFNRTWSKVKIGSADPGQPISSDPNTLLPGMDVRVLANMVVREGLPSNDADYFKGRPSLGVLPVGTKVRLASKPIAIDRGFAMQYWVEVEVEVR